MESKYDKVMPVPREAKAQKGVITWKFSFMNMVNALISVGVKYHDLWGCECVNQRGR